MVKNLFLLEEDEPVDFDKYLLNLNMSRGKIFTRIIMILECVLLLFTYVKPEFFTESYLKVYRYHYLVLFIFAFIFNVVSISYEKKIISNLSILTIYIYASVLLSLLWGVSLTRVDVANGGFITVYLTFLFMLSGIVVMKPVYSLLVLWTGHVVLVASTYSYDSFIDISINGTVFFIFAWVLTRQQYQSIIQKFTKNAIIEQKNSILEKQNFDLIRLTMVDHLTSLYNRYSLDDVLEKKWLEAYVNQNSVLALMIDIDDFKQINDTYGHMIGDKCLIEVSIILKEFVTTYDGYAFRYGGDEFCLIFYDPISLSGLIENIKLATSNMFILKDDKKIDITLTIGSSSEIPKTLESAWRIIDNADKVLYIEKSKRKRRISD